MHNIWDIYMSQSMSFLLSCIIFVGCKHRDLWFLRSNFKKCLSSAHRLSLSILTWWRAGFFGPTDTNTFACFPKQWKGTSNVTFYVTASKLCNKCSHNGLCTWRGPAPPDLMEMLLLSTMRPKGAASYFCLVPCKLLRPAQEEYKFWCVGVGRCHK